MCAKRSGGCAQPGVFLFRVAHTAFPGPQTKHGRRLRPLSLPVNGTRAKERTVTGKSEKLAQERLCGNRDRFAVGKRIGSRVWKVSHDLKGVRGLSRFLHRRECAGDYRFGSQRQYQTDLWVRTASHLQTHGTACALESPPSTVKGKQGKREWVSLRTLYCCRSCQFDWPGVGLVVRRSMGSKMGALMF